MADTFEAQWEHSLRMAQGSGRSLQERVDEYTKARRQDKEEKDDQDRHEEVQGWRGQVLGD